MKSPYQVARELGVSPQAVYKKMTPELINRMGDHVQRDAKGKYSLDEAAERLLKEVFNHVAQSDEQPLNNPVVQPLLNQLNTENTFLRQRIELLEQELKTEREHSRTQTDRITELAAEMAKLANNAQHLHGADIIPRLTSGDAPPMGATAAADPTEPSAAGEVANGYVQLGTPEKGFFSRLFNRKKN